VVTETLSSTTRRNVLAAALGALAAFAAQALGRPLPARAEGEFVRVGSEYSTATSRTYIRNESNDNDVLVARSTRLGTGVYGLSGYSIGVRGATTSTSAGYGVYGSSAATATGYGVYGTSNSSIGVAGVSGSNYGVFGSSGSKGGVLGSSGSGYGVYGTSTSNYGVFGFSSSHNGVYGRSTSGNGVVGYSIGAGHGVAGLGSTSYGVYGQTLATNQPAVVARSRGGNTGLLGVSGDVGSPVPTAPAKTGVYGYATQDASSKGVYGRSSGGRGVYGQATAGRGGSFEASTGIALHAKGRVQLETSSGTGLIASGTDAQTVTPGFDLTADSKVLVTLLADPGASAVVKHALVDATADSFTVYLTANATTETKFAWLVLV
jgi:hypothetical protein